MARHFNGIVNRFSAGGKSFDVTVRFPWLPAGVPAAEFVAHDVLLNGSPLAGFRTVSPLGRLEFTAKPTARTRHPAGELQGVIGRIVEVVVSAPHSPQSQSVSGRVTGIAVDPSDPSAVRIQLFVLPPKG